MFNGKKVMIGFRLSLFCVLHMSGPDTTAIQGYASLKESELIKSNLKSTVLASDNFEFDTDLCRYTAEPPCNYGVIRLVTAANTTDEIWETKLTFF